MTIKKTNRTRPQGAGHLGSDRSADRQGEGGPNLYIVCGHILIYIYIHMRGTIMNYQ